MSYIHDPQSFLRAQAAKLGTHTSKQYTLVGGLEHVLSFHIYIYIYIGNNYPNWLSSFSEGWVNHQPALIRHGKSSPFRCHTGAPSRCKHPATGRGDPDNWKYGLPPNGANMSGKSSRNTWVNFITTEQGESCSPEPWESWFLYRDIIPKNMAELFSWAKKITTSTSDLTIDEGECKGNHPQMAKLFRSVHHYLVGGLKHFSFFHILGISPSQLTFLFFRGVGTTSHIHRLSIDYS